MSFSLKMTWVRRQEAVTHPTCRGCERFDCEKRDRFTLQARRMRAYPRSITVRSPVQETRGLREVREDRDRLAARSRVVWCRLRLLLAYCRLRPRREQRREVSGRDSVAG